MKSKFVTAAGVLAALGLVSTACSGDRTSGEPPSTEVTSSNETPVDQDANQWALDYTGGKSARAEGAPIKIGYVNSESAFPESTIGLTAAITFVNEELGGAAGRPLEVVPCAAESAVDAATCGVLLASDPDIAAVLTGGLVAGNADLYAALDGTKPVIIGHAGTREDISTTVGKSFTAGAPGIAIGMARFIITELDSIERVALVSSNDSISRFVTESFLQPAVNSHGVRSFSFSIDQDADDAAVESIVQSIKDEEVDVVLLSTTVPQCIDVFDAMRNVEVDVDVVATGACASLSMSEHLREMEESGPIPDRWYVSGYGFNYFLPDVASGMDIFVKKIQQYGVPGPGAFIPDYTGLSGPSFANVLTLTKFINQVGNESIDFVSIDGAIRNFTGPMMLQAGPLNCEGTVVGVLPPMVSVCASRIGVQQFVDGQWRSVTDGLNGKAIDVSEL